MKITLLLVGREGCIAIAASSQYYIKSPVRSESGWDLNLPHQTRSIGLGDLRDAFLMPVLLTTSSIPPAAGDTLAA